MGTACIVRLVPKRRLTHATVSTVQALRAKSDPAKLALAARVRRETTLTLGWMAD